jgi:hypothetical protein
MCCAPPSSGPWHCQAGNTASRVCKHPLIIMHAANLYETVYLTRRSMGLRRCLSTEMGTSKILLLHHMQQLSRGSSDRCQRTQGSATAGRRVDTRRMYSTCCIRGMPSAQSRDCCGPSHSTFVSTGETATATPAFILPPKASHSSYNHS